MALYHDLSKNTSSAEDCFSFELKSNLSMICTYLQKTEEENQYVIANEEGNVLLTGKFKKQVEIKLNTLNDGRYELVLFNGFHRQSFPFRIAIPS